MTTFKQYLIEHDEASVYTGTPISTEDAIAWVNQHAPSFKKAAAAIYRGGLYHAPINLIDSNGFSRKSANSPTIVNTVVDGYSAWSEYPARSKGLICSTDSDTAANFAPADEDPLIVIPADDAKIGICPESDFWYCFPKISDAGDDAGGLSYAVHHVIKHLLKQDPKLDWSGLAQQLHDISLEQIKNIDATDRYVAVSHAQKLGLVRLFKEAGLKDTDSLYDAMTFAVEPTGFVACTGAQIWGKLLRARDREIWIQGKCLIAHANLFDTLQGK